MKKYFLLLFIALCFIISPPVFAEQSASSGFIPGQIWYSKLPLIEGETVNIHTAIWNSETNPLSAKVEFNDKNVILGSRDVLLSPSELKDVYLPWKVTSGDHVISAKIISSLATVSGKKEKIVLNRVSTSEDRQFVSVSVKNKDGLVVPGDKQFQTQIDKTTSEIKKIVPENVSSAFSEGFNTVESFRDRTLTEVTSVKNETKDRIERINSDDKLIEVTTMGVSTKDATEKPIAYVKLFLFSVLAFIFGNKLVFYGVIVIVFLSIVRFIYRKIRNK